MGRCAAQTALLALAIAACTPATSSAATTIGSISVPTSPKCSSTLPTWVQTGTPGADYEAPTAGVITSWSHQAASSPASTMRLRVVRRTSTEGTFTTVALSDPQSLLANQLNTFPTRIPVAAGDLIGFSVTANSTYDCMTTTTNGSTIAYRNDRPAAGSTDPFLITGLDAKVAISAKLEPDADGDGFGDETQDACPTDATTQGPCPIAPDTTPPETSITKSPTGKTKKKRATLNFTADDPAATFECAFDGSAFTACTSPTLKKNLARGKHVFLVRSTDAAGNTETTPARAEWKVIKKRKGKGGGK